VAEDNIFFFTAVFRGSIDEVEGNPFRLATPFGRIEAIERGNRLERAERLRLELEKIAWMDEFLDAEGARQMMQIARDAIQADEDDDFGEKGRMT
jgi:hypothetical protein